MQTHSVYYSPHKEKRERICESKRPRGPRSPYNKRCATTRNLMRRSATPPLLPRVSGSIPFVALMSQSHVLPGPGLCFNVLAQWGGLEGGSVCVPGTLCVCCRVTRRLTLDKSGSQKTLRGDETRGCHPWGGCFSFPFFPPPLTSLFPPVPEKLPFQRHVHM